jgi:hypothetical protein
MANEIRTKFDAVANFTITLAGLASTTARQSTIVANANNRGAAVVYLKIQAGAAAPAAGTIYEVYLLRDDGVTVYRSDNAGAADAAITIVNAQIMGTIVVTNTANGFFFGDFDTAPIGPLGPKWGIAIKNSTDQALGVTEANHVKEFAYYLPEIQ